MFRRMAAIAAVIFLVMTPSGQSVPTLCVSPVGAYDGGVWWRWQIDDSVLTNAGGVPSLKCKYNAEIAGAPHDGACVTWFTDPVSNVWLLTNERLNTAGQLVCRYAWQGLALPSGPELRGFRGAR